MPPSALNVVLVCHDSASDLEVTLGAVLAQLEAADELVVVDSGSSDGSADVARAVAPSAQVIDAGGNVGFAAGCRAGAKAGTAPLLLFLNPDVVIAEGCLAALRQCAEREPRWGAWQALVTMDGGRQINTAGNVLHYLGFGWAGRCGDPVASLSASPAEVGFGSGAALVVRRVAWEAVDGFDDRYFMYGEDLDLSLRLRLAGWGIGISPDARVEHGYEFSKGDYKWFYLERNRWWTILGVYPPRLLAVLFPALLALELPLLFAAWRGGWLAPKLRAQRAVVCSLPAILRRRRRVQASRVISERAFAEHLAASLDSPYLEGAARLPGVIALQAIYWRLALRALD